MGMIKRFRSWVATYVTPYRHNLFAVLRERAIAESASYVEQHLTEAVIFSTKQKLWSFAASRLPLKEGLVLEFGVFNGASINHFAERLPEATLFGFDSFEGLAEDWRGYHLTKGHFDLAGKLPKVRPNVTLVKGWFDKTLPVFLSDHAGPVRFVHIDCDTYESSLYVLSTLAPRLVAGTVIVFDEYYGYPNWRNGEFRAWAEVREKNGLDYDYIGFAQMQVAIVIK